MVDGCKIMVGVSLWMTIVPANILLVTTMTWPFPAQLAGAFAAVGARVEALCPPRAVLASSRHVTRLHRYNPVTAMESLCQAMATARADMIIPCDDLAAELVGREHGIAPIKRMEFLIAAAKAGAPCVGAVALDNQDGLEAAIRRLGLPLVIKSDNSWGGEGVVIAQTRQEALAAFRRLMPQSRLRNIARAMRGRGSHFLIRALHPVAADLSAQPFVEGRPATSSIACWRGEVVAAHHFDVVSSSTPTSPASVIAVAACPQMQEAARTVARAFNLSGLFGLDYIRDTKGNVYLLEMNVRATPTTHLVLQSDLPAALLSAAGLTARPRPPVTDKTEIALFPREWLHDPASPWLARAFHDVPWDDPEVVRACVRGAPPAARALLESAISPALTAKIPVFEA
jgi:hypothetical protein